MTKTLSNLRNDFPIWYREVSIEADDTRRSLRLDGISLLKKGADRDLTEGLVRIAFGVDRQSPSPVVLDRVNRAFRDKDPTFDPSTSIREVQVLAGACLAEIFNSSDGIGDNAALSVATAALNGVRKPNLPMDLAALAEHALDRRSVEARHRPDLTELRRMPTFKIGDRLAANPEEAGTEAIDSSDLATLAKEVQSAIRSVSARQTRMTEALKQFVTVQDEELQMLWWFLGGRSSDLDCDFATIAKAARPLVFGKELADETLILPGLRTVRALMARAGLNEKSKLSIPDMVNGAPVEWLRKVTTDWSPSPVTQPLHFAVSRRLEVEDEQSWIEAWASLSSIKAGHKIDVLTLGELIYREQLQQLFK